MLMAIGTRKASCLIFSQMQRVTYYSIQGIFQKRYSVET